MVSPDEDRTCPVCLQIVQSNFPDAFSVKLSSARKFYIHAGCAAKIAEKYNEWVGNVRTTSDNS